MIWDIWSFETPNFAHSEGILQFFNSLSLIIFKINSLSSLSLSFSLGSQSIAWSKHTSSAELIFRNWSRRSVVVFCDSFKLVIKLLYCRFSFIVSAKPVLITPSSHGLLFVPSIFLLPLWVICTVWIFISSHNFGW